MCKFPLAAGRKKKKGSLEKEVLLLITTASNKGDDNSCSSSPPRLISLTPPNNPPGLLQLETQRGLPHSLGPPIHGQQRKNMKPRALAQGPSLLLTVELSVSISLPLNNGPVCCSFREMLGTQAFCPQETGPTAELLSCKGLTLSCPSPLS